MEEEKILQFRERETVDRDTALKFLRARKFDIEKAIERYYAYRNLQKKYRLETLNVYDVLEELATQKLYLPGTCDKSNSTIFVINAERHIPDDFYIADTLRLAFFLCEVALREDSTQLNGFCVIIDMRNLKWTNLDTEFQKEMIKFFQDNIPGFVKHILLFSPPWWLKLVVNLYMPVMKDKIRNRIQIINNLDKFVDRSQLPVELGGDFEYDHSEFIQIEKKKFEELLSKGQVRETNSVRKAIANGKTIKTFANFNLETFVDIDTSNQSLASSHSLKYWTEEDNQNEQEFRFQRITLLDERIRHRKSLNARNPLPILEKHEIDALSFIAYWNPLHLGSKFDSRAFIKREKDESIESLAARVLNDTLSQTQKRKSRGTSRMFFDLTDEKKELYAKNIVQEKDKPVTRNLREEKTDQDVLVNQNVAASQAVVESKSIKEDVPFMNPKGGAKVRRKKVNHSEHRDSSIYRHLDTN